jgi:aryl-alcohol dehydrogenase-like predicted oxidoreductase
MDFSPAGINTQLEKSLERLQTNYIDIYLLHIPQYGISPQEIFTTLNGLKKSGKIKRYGVCNMY